MKPQIKHFSQNEKLVLFLFICPYILSFLLEFLKFPNLVKYFFDVVWAFLLLTMLTRKKNTLHPDTKKIKIAVLIFFAYTVFNYIIHFQSLFYYMWGFRNTFRGLVLFFSTIYYLKTEDANNCLILLDKLFYVNAIIAAIQFLVLGYRQDNLGGIFGVRSGCNGALNLYLCIMLAVYFVRFLNKKISIARLLLNFLIMLLVAAAGEIKFFYIEFMAILIVASLVTEFNIKKLIIIFGAFVALNLGYHFFINIFPDTNISVEYLIEYVQSDAGYSVSGGISRGTFFSYINDRFLNTLPDQILGLGLGNCDYASDVSLVTSPFYLKNGYTRYDWMSSSLLYLEHGILGSILYLTIFAVHAILLFRNKAVSKELSDISIVSTVVLIIVLFYNNSLKVESVYMIYFVLALPWTSNRERGNYDDSI